MTTTGSYWRGMLEYAGLGGDTSFVKSEGYATLARAFGQGWAWSVGARAGWMHTLDGRPAFTFIKWRPAAVEAGAKGGGFATF